MKLQAHGLGRISDPQADSPTNVMLLTRQRAVVALVAVFVCVLLLTLLLSVFLRQFFVCIFEQPLY